MIFVTDSQTPEVLQPGQKALHFPPTSIASEFSSIDAGLPYKESGLEGVHDKSKRPTKARIEK